MGQRIFIPIKVEQLSNAVWMGQRRVNVDVTVATARRKILILQLSKGNDLGDSLGMRPLHNVQLVLLLEAEHD